MIAITRGINRFDGRSRFTTWMYRVATNAALDEARRRKRRPIASEYPGDVATVADPTGAVDPRLDVDAALATLPPTTAPRWRCATLRGSTTPRSPRCSGSRSVPSDRGSPGAGRHSRIGSGTATTPPNAQPTERHDRRTDPASNRTRRRRPARRAVERRRSTAKRPPRPARPGPTLTPTSTPAGSRTAGTRSPSARDLLAVAPPPLDDITRRRIINAAVGRTAARQGARFPVAEPGRGRGGARRRRVGRPGDQGHRQLLERRSECIERRQSRHQRDDDRSSRGRTVQPRRRVRSGGAETARHGRPGHAGRQLDHRRSANLGFSRRWPRGEWRQLGRPVPVDAQGLEGLRGAARACRPRPSRARPRSSRPPATTREPPSTCSRPAIAGCSPTSSSSGGTGGTIATPGPGGTPHMSDWTIEAVDTIEKVVGTVHASAPSSRRAGRPRPSCSACSARCASFPPW